MEGRSLIQPKKQDSRIGSADGGWNQQRKGGWTKFEKRGLENIGGVGLHKIGGSRFSFCQP